MPRRTRDLLRFSYGTNPTLRRLPDWHTTKTELAVLDEQGNFYEATHWSSERKLHMFTPGADEHRAFPWPESDVEGFNEGLADLFFDPEGRHALIFRSGLVRGSGQGLNEEYRVP